MLINNGPIAAFPDNAITSDDEWHNFNTCTSDFPGGAVATIEILATDPDNSDAKGWRLAAVMSRPDSGDATVVAGAPDVVAGTAGAAAWDARVVGVGANMVVQIKGADGIDVHWTCQIAGITHYLS